MSIPITYSERIKLNKLRLAQIKELIERAKIFRRASKFKYAAIELYWAAQTLMLIADDMHGEFSL